MPKSTPARISNGTRSKNKWREKFPEKARTRNTTDCVAYYGRNADRINQRRRQLYKQKKLAPMEAAKAAEHRNSLLEFLKKPAAVPRFPLRMQAKTQSGLTGKLTPGGF